MFSDEPVWDGLRQLKNVQLINLLPPVSRNVCSTYVQPLDWTAFLNAGLADLGFGKRPTVFTSVVHTASAPAPITYAKQNTDAEAILVGRFAMSIYWTIQAFSQNSQSPSDGNWQEIELPGIDERLMVSADFLRSIASIWRELELSKIPDSQLDNSQYQVDDLFFLRLGYRVISMEAEPRDLPGEFDDESALNQG